MESRLPDYAIRLRRKTIAARPSIPDPSSRELVGSGAVVVASHVPGSAGSRAYVEEFAVFDKSRLPFTAVSAVDSVWQIG
jgi:hypothetical protein